MNASIAISRWNDGAVQFHVSGKVEASTEPYDMRLQRMLGHMPALLHRKPRSVLVVGFGAGVTAGSFVLHPEVQSIVICEMEPLIPPVGHALLRQGKLQRAERPARRNGLRRRAPLRPHHPREVRHHHLRPHPSVGQGQRHALLQGVFRAGEAAPEPGRHRHPVGAACTKATRHGEERAGDLLRRLSQRHHLGQRQHGGGYDTVLLGQAEPPQNRRGPNAATPRPPGPRARGRNPCAR